MDGNQVPQGLVKKVGEAFERILAEVCLLPPCLTLCMCVCLEDSLSPVGMQRMCSRDMPYVLVLFKDCIACGR